MSDSVTILAEDLTEREALRRWEEYMYENPGPALETSPKEELFSHASAVRNVVAS
jgi:hypothetical protein